MTIVRAFPAIQIARVSIATATNAHALTGMVTQTGPGVATPGVATPGLTVTATMIGLSSIGIQTVTTDPGVETRGVETRGVATPGTIVLGMVSLDSHVMGGTTGRRVAMTASIVTRSVVTNGQVSIVIVTRVQIDPVSTGMATLIGPGAETREVATPDLAATATMSVHDSIGMKTVAATGHRVVAMTGLGFRATRIPTVHASAAMVIRGVQETVTLATVIPALTATIVGPPTGPVLTGTAILTDPEVATRGTAIRVLHAVAIGPVSTVPTAVTRGAMNDGVAGRRRATSALPANNVKSRGNDAPASTIKRPIMSVKHPA
jgi:hypothetical protein